MATLSKIRAKVYGYLGTTSTDRAYPAAAVNGYVNDALNELKADAPSGLWYQRATWTADSATGRTYSLATQSPAVTSLHRIVEIRTQSTTGPKLRELTFEQLPAWDGLTFAVTGADEAATVTTGDAVAAGATLYVVFEAWPAELSADSDTPSWLAGRFHDVPALMAAEIAFALGGESRMPPTLATKLLDRRAQLQSHWKRRSLDVTLTRAPESAALA